MNWKYQWILSFLFSIQKVGSQSHQPSDEGSSTDHDEENRVIQQALNESDGNEKQPVSLFDLSPVLASGCAV